MDSLSFSLRLKILVLLFIVNGCSAATDIAGPSPTTVEIGSGSSGASQETTDLERLARLWHRRTQKGLNEDYPLGPGDVLDISVPPMQELNNVSVRVSNDGTISLPFVGLIKAGGLTEKNLREEIWRRLEVNYIHNPQVSLFVRQYRSRQVAVIGAVQTPGLYFLATGAETLLDAISLAGGMTKEAAPRIQFIPAEPVSDQTAKEVASILPAQLVRESPSIQILKSVEPIMIDLQDLVKPGNQIYLTLPVRAGDVVMVPGAGEVLVQGWVEKPGSYKITPGLTVLGAVAAAGGPMFAADINSVQVIRTDKQGKRMLFQADLEAIKRGEKLDIPVRESDVIDVSSSAPKLVAYGFYRFFSSIMHVGASVPLAR